MQAANGAGSETATRALEELCRIYRPALVSFARTVLGSAEEAEDATQDFFVDFLGRGRLEVADPSRGRFRTFVLTHFRLLLNDHLKRRRAAKRGGGRSDVEWDMVSEIEEPVTEAETGWLDAAWAARVVHEAMRRLEEEERGSRGAIPLAAVRGHLPGFQAEEPVSYVDVAREHGVSPGALRVQVSRLRQRFGEHINAVLADTVTEASDVDAEREALVAAASSPAFSRAMREQAVQPPCGR